MTYTRILLSVCAVWVASEILIMFMKRSDRSVARSEDRHSFAFLGGLLFLSPFLASLATSVRWARFPAPVQLPAFWCGIALIVIGFAIRLTAIFTLRKYFTVDVAIAHDHRVIDSGLYGIVRHPSYAGSLISFVGLGLAFVNWISFAILLIGPAIGLAYRIHVEEAALTSALGDDYRAYAARHKRLIPGIY